MEVSLEKLRKMKRKGSVLVFRFITEEYNVPLGVWVVREATRKALKDKGLFFGDKELMLKYSNEFVKKKFGINLKDFLKESILLKERKTQKAEPEKRNWIIPSDSPISKLEVSLDVNAMRCVDMLSAGNGKLNDCLIRSPLPSNSSNIFSLA